MRRSKTYNARRSTTRIRLGRMNVRRLALLAALLLFACALGATDIFRPLRHTHAHAATRGQASARQTNVAPQNIWQEIGKGAAATQAQRQSLPRAYRTLRLNRAGLGELLRQAPLEFSAAARDTETVVALPLPDGSLSRFRIEESAIMEPDLAARFPTIKTYRGQGLDDTTATTRFDWTPAGLHAIILSAHGTFYLEPYAAGDNATYLAYAHQDIADETGALACAVTEAEQTEAIKRASAHESSFTPRVASGANLRTYRLAVAATAEYTQTYGGGTVDGALSAITTTINLVDAIYERDAAIRLVLIAGETSIIFTDTTTDGYTTDNVGALINENPTKLNSVIGAGSYDIGHVFDGRLLSGGAFSFQGQAGIGVVCTASKGRGATIFRSVFPSDIIAYYIVAHEMGHQFGATHTFNANIGDCGNQRTASTAYEPGTGTTIMGYRFNCGSEDLRSSDTYFHNASLEQIVNYTTTGGGSICPTLTATGNNPPVVDAGASYTIPARTPFKLTGAGSDANGDALTYTWEEFDLGPSSPPDADDGARPIFRSFAPATNPARTFPQLSDILTNIQTFGESLPTTTRTMNFRITARDNRAGGGGIGSAATQVNVRADSGPFTVTAPATNVNWAGNTLQPVTWNVANTTSAPVSCANVRILVSTDGGLTFPYFTNSTPNDGTENILVPNVPTTTARVKVEAVGNIFFDISDANFTILNNPCSYTLSATSQMFFSSGGTGSVNITTSSNCAWTATSNADWITITAGAAGSGNGTVSYTVASNSGGPARTGTISIAGQTFTVMQSVGCTYAVSAPVSNFPAQGGQGVLNMTAGPTCQWRVTSLASWITITAGSSGTGNGTINFTVAPNPGLARSGQILHTDDSFITISQAAGAATTVGFESTAFTANEGDGRATITVFRNGDKSGVTSVGYMTVDDPAAVRCDTVNGTAYARCDYATTIDTLTFAPGEVTKSFTIPLIDDAHVEGSETVRLKLFNPVGAALDLWSDVPLTINDNDKTGAANPIFTTPFFVRQHYLDFLAREPEPTEPWSNILNNCANVNNTDPTSPSAACDRITVSGAFFGSPEFLSKGVYTIVFYRAAFNRLPTYAEFAPDLRSVTGATAAETNAKRAAFADNFVLRAEFVSQYGALANGNYVSALLGRYSLTQVTTPDPQQPDGTVKVTLTSADLVSRLNNSTLTRAQVLRAIVQSDEVTLQREATTAFVAAQYYGYLRRTPDVGGFNGWVNYLSAHPGDFRTMVNGFMNSIEYRLRFGAGQ